MKRVNQKTFPKLLEESVVRAQRSIEISISPFHPQWIRYVRELPEITDRIAQRRVLLPGFDASGRPTMLETDDETVRKAFIPELRRFLDAGWDVKSAEYSRLGFVIMFDRQQALHSFPAFREERVRRAVARPEFVEFDGDRELYEFTSQFDEGWKSGIPFARIYLNADLVGSDTETQKRIVSISAHQFDQLVKHFAKNPTKLRHLEPHKFEELVARLFEQEGFEVELTQLSRDGGRDILVSSHSEVGKTLHLVECKRFSETRPVGVALLRSLYGVVEEQRATSGVLVTTTRFTPPALEFVTRVPHRMATKDYDDVVKWIRKHA